MKEVFKDVINYKGLYKVSNLGRVKSLDSNLKRKGRVLKAWDNLSGYLIISLSKNGKSKSRSIHQLVAESFLNHTPCGFELVVNHIDFDKHNNNVKNLEIVTTRENTNLKHVKSSSKYVGVYWYKTTNKWKAQIYLDGKMRHLGYFHNEVLAHNAYKAALINKPNK